MPRSQRPDAHQRKNLPKSRHGQKETHPPNEIQEKSRTPPRLRKSLRRKIPTQSRTASPQNHPSSRSQRRKQKPRRRPPTHTPRRSLPRQKNQTIHPQSTRQSLTKIRHHNTHRNRPPRKTPTRRNTINEHRQTLHNRSNQKNRNRRIPPKKTRTRRLRRRKPLQNPTRHTRRRLRHETWLSHRAWWRNHKRTRPLFRRELQDF